MVYIRSLKGQNWLLPPSIDDLIPKDHICFLVEEYGDSLDFSKFDEMFAGAGRPAYPRRILLKVIVMGLIDKIRSSRKLARSARENVVYMYLAEKLVPDFRTISDFRKENHEFVKDAFQHLVSLAKEEDLLDLSSLATDGSKIKANASNKKTLTGDELAFLKKFVDKEMDEWDKQDKAEDKFFGEKRGHDQIPANKEKIKKMVEEYNKKCKEKKDFAKNFKKKLEKASDELSSNKLKKVSMTDPESRFLKNKKGRIELSYNPQITVDKNGFILANDVCRDTNDTEQLKPQVLMTENNLGSLPKNTKWSFDNNYHNGENLLFLNEKKIDAYIPDQEIAQLIKGKTPKTTYLSTLTYCKKNDTFQTKEGEILTFTGFCNKKTCPVRRYALKKDKKIIKEIEVRVPVVERHEMHEKMMTQKGRDTYKIRSQTVEPAIGDIKENRGFTSFLTRSFETIKTEFNLVCIAHNLVKIYNIKKTPNPV